MTDNTSPVILVVEDNLVEAMNVKNALTKAGMQVLGIAKTENELYSFVEKQVRYDDGKSLISYGTSSYGYDVRCANEFKVFTNINSAVVDPKSFDETGFVDLNSEVCVIPPNSFVLARTVEYFRIPRNVLTICLGKSTYARCGIIVNVTPLEPEWEGHVTLEFSNPRILGLKILLPLRTALPLIIFKDPSANHLIAMG